MVTHVERTGTAERAGLLVGDVIVEINGHRTESIDDLHRFLTSDLVGRETALTLLRLEKKLFVNVVPQELKTI
jgi:S1-C subfamily serine protease